MDKNSHSEALAELVRVARREVRIFPLVVQRTGQPVTFLDDRRVELDAIGYRLRLRSVPYRFQCRADHMLFIETK